MQWDIQARSRVCSGCRREFLDGDTYRCVLSYREDAPIREDFCAECWQNRRQPELQNGENLISWWRGSVRIPPPKPKEEAIKRSHAEELLRKYFHSPDPKYVNFCYILALMLERRRVLVQKHAIQEDPSGRSLIVYEHSRTGETFIILNPHLSLSRIGKVQAQVKEILDAEKKAQEEQTSQEDEDAPTQAEDTTEQESQQ
jgi:hypothetical protein